MKHTLTLFAGLLLGQLAALHAQEYSTRLAADERQSRPSVERLFHESQVWAANEAGLKAHHVFGLCRSEKGTVLAFCEGRIEPDDLEPHHVLLKRSTDRGATWGKDIFVERSDGRESFANPTPVVDRHTGRIFLFYALNIDNQRSQVFYRTSDDDGVTWSDRTEVSRLFDGDQLKRPFHLPGPGHAVQLHSGRLVVPIWHRLAISRDYKSPPWEKRLYATSVITSDDGEKTWRAGEFTPTEFHCNESRVVELSDGQLLLNSRSVGFLEEGEKRRVEARSRDAGATWASSAWSETFPSFTPCDTGFIRLDHATYIGTDAGHLVGVRRVLVVRHEVERRHHLVERHIRCVLVIDCSQPVAERLLRTHDQGAAIEHRSIRWAGGRALRMGRSWLVVRTRLPTRSTTTGRRT